MIPRSQDATHTINCNSAFSTQYSTNRSPVLPPPPTWRVWHGLVARHPRSHRQHNAKLYTNLSFVCFFLFFVQIQMLLRLAQPRIVPYQSDVYVFLLCRHTVLQQQRYSQKCTYYVQTFTTQTSLRASTYIFWRALPEVFCARTPTSVHSKSSNSNG